LSPTNKFASLADQLNDSSFKLSHSAQELNTEMAGEDQQSMNFYIKPFCLFNQLPQ